MPGFLQKHNNFYQNQQKNVLYSNVGFTTKKDGNTKAGEMWQNWIKDSKHSISVQFSFFLRIDKKLFVTRGSSICLVKSRLRATSVIIRSRDLGNAGNNHREKWIKLESALSHNFSGDFFIKWIESVLATDGQSSLSNPSDYPEKSKWKFSVKYLAVQPWEMWKLLRNLTDYSFLPGFYWDLAGTIVPW